MLVEECCQAILWEVLPSADRKRKGLCIDIGVGTFAFYCELFSRRGFQTVAVEPVPVEAVKNICQLRGIRLIEYCISDYSGMQKLYLGTYDGQRDMNLSSLLPEWWGASQNARDVKSITLSELLSMLTPTELTCLKLDVEGMEHRIIPQLSFLPPRLLPKIFMFEYGGGNERAAGQGGWVEPLFTANLRSLSLLKALGYRMTVVVDSAPHTTERLLDLATTDLDPDRVFHSHAIYGNIIAFRGFQPAVKELTRICKRYYENTTPSKRFPFLRRMAGGRIRRFLSTLRSR